jgi:hypothetical protein
MIHLPPISSRFYTETRVPIARPFIKNFDPTSMGEVVINGHCWTGGVGYVPQGGYRSYGYSAAASSPLAVISWPRHWSNAAIDLRGGRGCG